MGVGKVTTLPSNLAEAQLCPNQPLRESQGPAVRGSWPLGLRLSRGRAHDKVQALP